MCEIGLILGLAGGMAQASAQADADAKNRAQLNSQARLQHASNERKFVVEQSAAVKDGNQAFLEAERAKSHVKTAGGGMYGSTMAARGAEQGRQGALSIANARDRADAANANYALAGKETQIGTQNQLNTNKTNPLTSIVNIATAGISNYGAFR